MDEFDGILVLLDAAGGRISGRTAIQKLGYFSMVQGAIRAHYRPHYYGPYSADIAGAIQMLVSYGFIDERVETAGDITAAPDWKRYTYTLTDDGRELAQEMKQEYPDDAAEVKQIVEICTDAAHLDSKTLSWAAKVHYIKTQEQRFMPAEEIREIARALNWDLSEEQVREGMDLLTTLHLMTG